MLHSSLSNSVRFKLDYQGFHKERTLFTRRLMNLFTTGRSYIDHTAHYMSQLFEDKAKAIVDIRAIESLKIKKSFGYRVIEKLRNYVQHRGLPIHAISFNFNRIDTDNSFKLLFTITPNLTPRYIEEDERFNREVLSEMKGKGKDIDIRPLVREYIEVLGNIHADLRKTLHIYISQWEETILSAIDHFQKEHTGEGPIALYLITEDDGTLVDSTALIKEVIESRKNLENKNQNLINLTKRYVTSEIIEQKKKD